MAGPGAVKLDRVIAIAGAGNDQQIGVILAQFAGEALGQHRLVHREHDGRCSLDPQPRQRLAARRITKDCAIA